MKKQIKGIATIYMVFLMTVLCGLASLAVDFGRVELVKTQLRRTVDGAARAGAAGIVDGPGNAIALARQYGNLNNVDTHSLIIQGGDIKFGFWDTTKNIFNRTGDFSQVNAIWISARMDQSRGSAVPLLFAPVIGVNSCSVTADSIAMVIPAINVDQDIQATADPFLSGMPAGSIASTPNPANDPDFAGTTSNPRNSPVTVGMPITSGATYTFDSIAGNARHDPNLTTSNPDGDINDPNDPIGHNNMTTVYDNNYGPTMYNDNGIADAWIPINALVGVFLDDNAPNTSPAPANLDFRTPASRDFSSLQPQLQQLFFIGDGLDSHGNHQNFIAPKGATRLFLATMDYYQWSNNSGYREVKISRPQQIITVK
jgi:hypothetical protein